MKLYCLLLFLLSSGFLFGQNLVPNPSFEDNKLCPTTFNYGPQTFYPNFWYAPTAGTPDNYNKCCPNRNSVRVPDNAFGYQYARTGNGYMGFVTYDKGSIDQGWDFREYIQVKLSDSLKKGEMYCVKLFVSLADSSNYSSSGIGIVLSKEAIRFKKNKTYASYSDEHQASLAALPFLSQIKNDSNNFISNDTGWVEISGMYKSTGGEQYITIGNFNPAKRNAIQKRLNIVRTKDQPGSTNSYYYVDDVSVIQITSEFDCLSENKPVPLKNIFFDTGKSTLLPKSFPELDKLVTSLKNNSDSKMEVAGHTDNSGKENENLKLSTARAKAVADYLISKGIKKDRVKFKGYGSSKPIAKNDTEEGKQQNRRVEIGFLK